MTEQGRAERKAAVKARHVQIQTTAVAQQLTQFDGLALDTAPERRKRAVWIAANFMPKG